MQSTPKRALKSCPTTLTLRRSVRHSSSTAPALLVNGSALTLLKTADVADVFEEDFESTDDERDTRDEEEDEDRVLEKEERAARRVGRQLVLRLYGPAQLMRAGTPWQAEKQKGRHYHNPLAAPRSTAVAGTGGPSATARPKSAIRRVIESADDASDGPSRKKRRVSVVAPGEDGANQHNGGDSRGDGDEAGDNAGDGEADAPARRFHVRASTVKNKLDVDDRLREQKERTVS